MQYYVHVFFLVKMFIQLINFPWVRNLYIVLCSHFILLFQEAARNFLPFPLIYWNWIIISLVHVGCLHQRLLWKWRNSTVVSISRRWWTPLIKSSELILFWLFCWQVLFVVFFLCECNNLNYSWACESITGWTDLSACLIQWASKVKVLGLLAKI